MCGPHLLTRGFQAAVQSQFLAWPCPGNILGQNEACILLLRRFPCCLFPYTTADPR